MVDQISALRYARKPLKSTIKQDAGARHNEIVKESPLTLAYFGNLTFALCSSHAALSSRGLTSSRHHSESCLGRWEPSFFLTCTRHNDNVSALSYLLSFQTDIVSSMLCFTLFFRSTPSSLPCHRVLHPACATQH